MNSVLERFCIFNRELSSEKHQDKNEISHDLSKGVTSDTHTPGDSKLSPKSVSSDTKHSHGVPPSEETASSPGARANSPEEESELFSTDYVDKLVASFWTKVDQKIEEAVSNYQASPQAGQQTNTQDNAQTQDTEADDKSNGKRRLFSC